MGQGVEFKPYIAVASSTYVKPNLPLAYSKPTPQPPKEKTPTERANEWEAFGINLSDNDEEKIINYNKNHATSNYVIVDKKNCKATVHKPNGEVISTYEVGVGKAIGDKRCGGLQEGEKARRYTTPGEFTINNRSKATDTEYGEKLFYIAGDHTEKEYVGKQTLALHQIPKSHLKSRTSAFGNNTLEDNRMSFGCINFLARDFDKMAQEINGVGTKVYILPEETDNKLSLENQNGRYKFVQTKY